MLGIPLYHADPPPAEHLIGVLRPVQNDRLPRGDRRLGVFESDFERAGRGWFWETDRHGQLVYISATVAARLGRPVSELLGQPFSDDIHLAVKAVNADGSRNLVMSVFTGERARDPLPVPDMTGNPLLVLFLDRAVNNYHSLAGGAQPYIKQQIRAALRDKAKVEPVKLDYQGKTVDALRVSVVPFIGDPNAAKMSGYEGSEFTFVVSNDVPGQLATMVSKYESGLKDSPKLEESITLAGVGEVK